MQSLESELKYNFKCVLYNSLSVSQVSQAAAELQQYCLQNAGKDALLVGVPTGSNPFREPRSCAVVWWSDLWPNFKCLHLLQKM